jgi:hypothetical protein
MAEAEVRISKAQMVRLTKSQLVDAFVQALLLPENRSRLRQLAADYVDACLDTLDKADERDSKARDG